MSDVRDAVRALRAAPVVTAVAVLSLAFGTGANAAIFSIVDSLMLRSLPVHEPDRLALLVTDPSARMTAWTNPQWEQIRGRPALVAGALAWSTDRFNPSRGGETEFVNAIWTSGSFFDVLGVPPFLGRTFTPEDDRRGGGPGGAAAVISYAFWQQRYGGAADAIGRTLTLERVPYTIVGVAPPGFFGTDVGRSFDVAVPLGTEPLMRGPESFLDRRSTWWLSIMLRLKPGQTLEAAQASIRGVQPQIRDATLPDNYRQQDLAQYLKEPFTLQPAAAGASFLRTRYAAPLLAIMAVVALVLLIACANIANLLLARATARRHEFSLRLAVGASRWRLARQLLVESLLLAGAGAALGLIVAEWLGRLIVRQLSTQSRQVFLEMPLDWRMLAFTAGIAVATALLFGVVPALRAAGAEPMGALREQGRGGGGEGRIGMAGLLVAGQVALSLVLVVGAGLFVRTFASLASLDLGFDRDPVLIVEVDARHAAPDAAQRAGLYSRARDAAAGVPGVAHAAVSLIPPVGNMIWNDIVEVENGPDLPERDREANINGLTPGWFAAYGTALLAGRDFDARDRPGAPGVVIVNEAFARKYLGGGSPIGRRVREVGRPDRQPPWVEVVGVAADAVYVSLREPVPPTIYKPLAQALSGDGPSGRAFLAVRSAGAPPALLTRSVAAAVSAVDPGLALTFRPLRDQIDAALLQERLIATRSAFFGVLALLLAGIGLYGVTSYAVSRRRAEIGIRMALGAEPGGVVRLVLARVGVLVAAGVFAGGLIAAWAATFVEALLFGMPPRDPATLAGAALVLATVGGLAGWMPARRASRIDPARVLREG